MRKNTKTCHRKEHELTNYLAQRLIKPEDLMRKIRKRLRRDRELTNYLVQRIIKPEGLTNSMAYETRRFNTAFTRALQ